MPGCCSTVVFIPSVEKIKEGAIVPDFPEKLMESAPHIPTIIGYNDREGILLFLCKWAYVIESLKLRKVVTANFLRSNLPAAQIPRCLDLLLNDLSIVVKNNFHLDESQQNDLLARIKEFYFKSEVASPQSVAQILDVNTFFFVANTNLKTSHFAFLHFSYSRIYISSNFTKPSIT